MTGDFERRVEMSPAFDKRSPNPRMNYGIHGVELRMVLIGTKGATQFVLYTNWQLPHVEAEFDKRPHRERFLDKPMPADLGYHSPTPIYEVQEPRGSCEYLNGHPCYHDGSGLNAEPIFDVLLREGSEGVWRELTSYYNDTFAEPQP